MTIAAYAAPIGELTDGKATTMSDGTELTASVAICRNCGKSIVWRPDGWFHQVTLQRPCKGLEAEPMVGTVRRQVLNFTRKWKTTIHGVGHEAP